MPLNLILSSQFLKTTPNTTYHPELFWRLNERQRVAYSRCSVIAGSHSNLTPPHPMSLKKEEMVSSFLPTAWPAININCPYMVPSRHLVTAYFTRFLRVRCSCFEVGAFWQQPLTPSLFLTFKTISSLGLWGSHGCCPSPIPGWISILYITQEQDEFPEEQQRFYIWTL